MTLYDLRIKIRRLEYALGGMSIPILKDGKEVDLDFHIVSEGGVVKHIGLIER